MPIPVVCPSCAAKLRAPDDMAGRKTKCPKCGTAVVVPTAVRKVEGPTRVEPASRPVKGAEPLLRPKPTAAPVPDDRPDFPTRASRAESAGGRTGVWIGLGSAALALVLAVIGATLWATGFLSDGQARQPGNTQALIASEKESQSPPKGTTAEPKPAGPMSEPPKETPKQPKSVSEVPKEVPPQPKREPEQQKPQEPYDLKGDRLGMSLQDFKAKYRRTFDAGKRYEAPFCSDHRDEAARESKPLPTLGEEAWHPKAKIVNARITFPFEDYKANKHTPTLAEVKTDLHLYRFVDNRLYRIEYVFPYSGFAKVQEAMVETYGKPTTMATKEYQNAFGAKFAGVVCTWDNGVSAIILTERSVDLKTSLLMYTHRSLDKMVESRRAQFRKTGL